MILPDLCEILELPVMVSNTVKEYADSHTSVLDEKLREQLYKRECWDQAVKELQSRIGEDLSGFYILSELLQLACQTYKSYRAKGIGDTVFVSTMQFCTRFLEDHKKTHGNYAFEWAWWFVRELSMQEFRIGTLEYEFVDGEERRIYVHIPSDARMAPGYIQESFSEYRKFLRQYYPEWTEADWYCDSWMMSPELKKLLPEDSNILAFQGLFEMISVDYESMAALDWVYPGEKTDYADLPENTSLQRSMKKFLLGGGKVGWAEGKLRSDQSVPCDRLFI